MRQLLTTLIACTACLPVTAATIVVDTLGAGSQPGFCSLHDAVTAANTNQAVNDCRPGDAAVADEIVFATATPGQIPAAGTLVLTESATLSGPGRDLLFVEDNILLHNPRSDFVVRGLTVLGSAVGVRDAQRVRLEDLTIQDGYFPAAAGGALILVGLVESIELDHCYLIGSTGRGGAIGLEQHSRVGSLRIVDSAIAANHATDGAGALTTTGQVGRLHLAASDLVSNRGTTAGALSLGKMDSVRIERSRFDRNRGESVGAIDVFDVNEVAILASQLWRNEAPAVAGARLRSVELGEIAQSTFVGNGAESWTQTLEVDGSEVVLGGNLLLSADGPELCRGSARSAGYNFASDATCWPSGPGDRTWHREELYLTDGNRPWGGAVLMPWRWSPAVDAIPEPFCLTRRDGSLFDDDLRGLERPADPDGGAVPGGLCDVGAVERRASDTDTYPVR